MKSRTRLLSIASAVALATGLAACAGDPYGPNNYPVSSTTVSPVATYPAPALASVEFGRITNVSLVSGVAPVATPNRSAVGTVLGAVIGGVLGNQIGSGTGRAAATVLGAVAGGAAGNRIAQNTAPTYAPTGAAVYRVSVQTDQGAMRTFDVSANADLRVGDRVRIENGVIYMG
ncbi:MAG TPA: glycine zipper 2TM domain-containing protein [Ramlibacter sp.]|nr:glycine zipper 2TM domain-containing protein [Ramlibacter sp.]